jgi:hypothetical protein
MTSTSAGDEKKSQGVLPLARNLQLQFSVLWFVTQALRLEMVRSSSRPSTSLTTRVRCTASLELTLPQHAMFFFELAGYYKLLGVDRDATPAMLKKVVLRDYQA